MANPMTAALQGEVLPAQGQQPQGQQQGQAQSPTALLDALISRGLGEQGAQQQLVSATPLEGFPTLPNPDPNSAPPLYGEPPGEGYLYARDPWFRQAALVHTDPDVVRLMILRAMEVTAYNMMLPFSQEKVAGNADALLKAAQAYLLIDPSVDNEGVPVATKAGLTAATTAAGHASQAAVQPAQSSTTQPTGPGAHGQVKRGKPVGGFTPPPRVLPGAAAQAVAEMHEHASELLQDVRGSRPRPKPRPSS